MQEPKRFIFELFTQEQKALVDEWLNSLSEHKVDEARGRKIETS